MPSRLTLCLALFALALGSPSALGRAVAVGGESCVCVETAADSCCAVVVEEPSCCEETPVSEGAPRWTPGCSCGKHAPLPTLPGSAPTAPAGEYVVLRDASQGERAALLEDQVAGRSRSAPEPPPPRA